MNIYIITSGEYSDYGIDYIVAGEKELTDELIHSYWLEAISRRDGYVSQKLIEIANYLNVPPQKDIFDYSRIVVDFKIYREALDAVNYKRRGDEKYLLDILQENGFKELEYTEFNTDCI